MAELVHREFLPYIGSFAVDPQLYAELLTYPLVTAVLGVLSTSRGRNPWRMVHGAAVGYVVGAIVLLGILPDLPMPEFFGAPRHPVELRPLRLLFPPPSTGVGWSSMIKQYAGNIAYFVPFGAVAAAWPGVVPRLWTLTLASSASTTSCSTPWAGCSAPPWSSACAVHGVPALPSGLHSHRANAAVRCSEHACGAGPEHPGVPWAGCFPSIVPAGFARHPPCAGSSARRRC